MIRKRILLIILTLGIAPILDSTLISVGATTSNFRIVENKTKFVYYCTGPKAKRFHKTPYCQGLNKCSGRIVECSTEEAKKKGFSPCRRCYKR